MNASNDSETRVNSRSGAARWGWFLLPWVGVIIAGLVAYKLTRPVRGPAAAEQMASASRMAPPFQLHDQNSKMVRLAAYQGRHKIVVLFYSATPSADQHPQVQWLKDHEPELTRMGVKILPISTTTPYFNREAIKRGGKFPFPLLSDPTLQAHRDWGAIDPETNQPKPALFILDHLGMVRYREEGAGTAADLSRVMETLNTIK